MPPTEVEQLVTYPIEQAMLGMPNKQEVRSLSELGLSMVTMVFEIRCPCTSRASSSTSGCSRLPANYPGESNQYWDCLLRLSANSISTL